MRIYYLWLYSMDGLVIVAPHGQYIREGRKKILIKSRAFYGKLWQPHLLIESKRVLGIIVLRSIRQITLREYHTRQKEHLITEVERKRWWPGYRKLYLYRFTFQPFAQPYDIEYPTGPQNFVSHKLISRP